MLLDLSFYWITRLDAFQTIAIFLAIFSGVVAIVTFIIGVCFRASAFDKEDDDYITGKILCKCAIIAGVFFFVGLIGSALIPSTKEYCAIKLVEYLESNEKARELPDKIIDKAYEYFDNELKTDEKEK